MLARAVLSLSLLAPAAGRADDCPPAAELHGDADVIEDVARVLVARGIALASADAECVPIVAHVDRRDQAIIVRVGEAERSVREAETAATVIESFARDDVHAPLLPAAASRARRPPSVPPRDVAESVEPSAETVQGPHAFASLESTLASDRTGWLGLQLGACTMVGPVCVAGRLRTSALASNPDDETRRTSWELLLGIDVPFVVRGWLVSPGFGAGPSGMTTKIGDMHYRTNGLRADAHATVTFPMTRRFGLDVHVAANLMQQVHLDAGDGVPVEPWGFFRVGLGLRYGRR
ncbi:MAG: hypothetical protein SFX73_08055 [Kofleriaceae bacterium]|nr:hypothetical protein [Kofleriaceae bacterium]